MTTSDIDLRATLRHFGARESDLSSLAAYMLPPFEVAAARDVLLPLPDEPFVPAWRALRERLTQDPSSTALTSFLVELQPLRTDHAAELSRQLHGASVVLHSTLAGHLPVLQAASLESFQALVCALTRRPPGTVLPTSMRAQLVGNYRNQYRLAEWRAAAPDREHTSLGQVPHDVYFDRFAVLAPGLYSNVPAHVVGMPEQQWLQLSQRIRLEHECTHYATRRLFGAMRVNLADELLADVCALMKVTGALDPQCCLAFYGLDQDDLPAGVRLRTYVPPDLTAEALAVIARMVRRAIEQLYRFTRSVSYDAQSTKHAVALLCAIASHSLPALTAREAHRSLSDAYLDVLRNLHC